eukprot:scaffold181542_cov18-Tisochrysis_lutea.AAC.1
MPYAAGGAGSASAGGAWQHKLQSKLPPQQQLQQQGGVSGSGVNSSLQAGVQQQQPVPPPRPGTRPVGNFLEAPRAKDPDGGADCADVHLLFTVQFVLTGRVSMPRITRSPYSHTKGFLAHACVVCVGVEPCTSARLPCS